MSGNSASVYGALGALLLLCACSSSEEPAAPVNTPPPGAVRVDGSKTGDVKGRVMFEGTPPENPIVRMGSDPFCARENPGTVTFQTVLVKDGGLDNVFVYVKDGLGNYYFDTPTEPAKLDNHGCKYVPHVMGVRVGQPIEISNSDQTMHNVNALPKVNHGFNFSLILPGMKQTKTFTAREVMVFFKCDVHPWMNAYVGVVDHPYYAVTADGGTFELKNLPAGTYKVEAWHEKLGTQLQDVTLGEKESKAIGFTFKLAAATN
jgi:plastocyanin